MRLISWILFVAVGTAAVLFAVDNRETVSLGLWPLSAGVDLPLFVPVMVAAALGFLCGGTVAWLGGHRWRSQARRHRRTAEALERRLHAMEEQARRNTAPVSAGPSPDGRAVAVSAPVDPSVRLPRRASG